MAEPLSRSVGVTCSANACGRPVVARGLCRRCYQRLRTAGRLAEAPVSPFRRERLVGGRCSQEKSLWAYYRLTLERFNALLEAQGGICAVPHCGATTPGGKGSWHVDHDHRCCPGRYSCGKCIRGLLCYNCNIGLGQFGDDPARLRGALMYLELPNPSEPTIGVEGQQVLLLSLVDDKGVVAGHNVVVDRLATA